MHKEGLDRENESRMVEPCQPGGDWERGAGKEREPPAAGAGEATMARIRLEKLVKTFGNNITAVAGINLDIHDGEFMIFVGPSGCGKTTTLNMISGLEHPTSGRVIIDERVVNDIEPASAAWGWCFRTLPCFRT
jgi:ABC-type glutathione transport system ATPase component